MAIIFFLKKHWDMITVVLFWLISLLFEFNRRLKRDSINQQKNIPDWAVTVWEKEARKKDDLETMRFINFSFLFSVLIFLIGNHSTFSSSLIFLITKILILAFLAVVFVFGGYIQSKR